MNYQGTPEVRQVSHWHTLADRHSSLIRERKILAAKLNRCHLDDDDDSGISAQLAAVDHDIELLESCVDGSPRQWEEFEQSPTEKRASRYREKALQRCAIATSNADRHEIEKSR